MKKSTSSKLLPLSVAVLMGGESKRFGSSKAHLPFGGKSLAAHLLGTASDFSEEVFAVSRNLEQVPPDVRSSHLVVQDVWEEKGPLSGLHAALLHSSYAALFLGGVDMPFLKREVVEGFYHLWEKTGRPLALVPGIAGRWEPLCALWSRELLGFLRPGKVKSFQKLLDGKSFPVREVTEGELRRFDPKMECLKNFNTLQEWNSAFLRR